ncbi:hypothetical protein Zm00014a_014772 [Zea mays]|uniref:Uncharacterized protein n=1 Tax=Zea mays TaxID=4577 RepID=A0A3L6EUN0_MAIZE|nr:hypothetical protein Zm00014a_014772 [Zea mays]
MDKVTRDAQEDILWCMFLQTM